ncbi:MAG: ABC transporter ATP-binding protein [Thermomicrobia bacterium]|nr:ABC transporter ATP-binding protein [Thermomicrobia bacterium]
MTATTTETQAAPVRAGAVALDVVGLGKVYGDKWAVADLSLAVPPGALVALLGPSGCGKTTTLRMIAGLIEPDAGDIHFDGASVARVPPERRGAVMVFQQPTLFSHLDVAANIGFGLRMRREPRAAIAERVRAALAQVQLSGMERRRIGQLSGGQQQRVALARALVTAPRVLLLDEPLSNLDPSLRDEMRDLIARLHAEQGITTVLVTHDRQEAMTLAERIAFLSDGSLHQYAVAPALYERPATVAVAQFFGMVNLFPAALTGGVAETALGRLRATDAASDAAAVIIGIRPEHVSVGAGENAVTARVTGRTYLGQQQRVTLRTTCGDAEITMLVPADMELIAGEEITVSLPAERLRIISTDPQ